MEPSRLRRRNPGSRHAARPFPHYALSRSMRATAINVDAKEIRAEGVSNMDRLD
jgi:hypothetical protein